MLLTDTADCRLYSLLISMMHGCSHDHGVCGYSCGHMKCMIEVLVIVVIMQIFMVMVVVAYNIDDVWL